MKKSLPVVVVVALSILACPRAPRPLVFGRIDHEREAPEVVAAKEQSPALWSKAEALRLRAEDAYRKGDQASAELLGEHAIAAYQHAISTARYTKATIEKSRIATRLAKATESRDEDEKTRLEIEREADKLEAEIAVRKEALAPASSGPTDAARDAARWVASRVNVAAAEVLCEGANLLAPKAKPVIEARKVLSEVSAKVSAGKGDAPIDSTTRVRALCLKALTHARDVAVKGGGPAGDALVAQLASVQGVETTRDDRGVVVTLSGAFAPDTAKLTKAGKDQLESIGRVAKSAQSFAIVIVVHSAPGQTNTLARDKDRAAAAKSAIASAGGVDDSIALQTPLATLPAYDTTDPKTKAKNERLEIIFAGGK